MTQEGKNPDQGLIEQTWAEARDLVRRLEGSSVQRFAVKAGEYEIEIERGAVAPPAGAGADAGGEAAAMSGHVAPGATVGLGVAPEARGASGAFSIGDLQEADNRVPVLAPLVGTFYEAAQPGSKPFVQVGDVVEPGQTVCIVEAMKLMNEVSAAEGGKVAEIVASNGDPVEFEQVLMYLEPDGG
jgi:acetyl-CoA carboxylase biotin carboxyl carrier protein